VSEGALVPVHSSMVQGGRRGSSGWRHGHDKGRESIERSTACAVRRPRSAAHACELASRPHRAGSRQAASTAA
jgi:hypothetical protein